MATSTIVQDPFDVNQKMEEAKDPKSFAFPIIDYPVSLALWHWNMNGVATPISGDKGKSQ